MLTASPNHNSESTLLNSDQCTPLALVGHGFFPPKRYANSKVIQDLAIKKYREAACRICYTDLVEASLAHHKRLAQYMLKHYLKRGILFTLRNCRPQQYYPRALESEIRKVILQSTPIDPTGARHYSSLPSSSPFSKGPLSNSLRPTIHDYLDYVILPLLQAVPPDIHNIHFKTKISQECYSEQAVQDLPSSRGNRGKNLSEIIGNMMVLYTFYPSGTVVVQALCSNTPFKLETELDHGLIIAFFGQIRDRLIIFLNDRHERIVPDLMEWQITECDVNRDLKAKDWLQFTGASIQVKHLDHLFRIYIKSMGRDAVCRVEEEKHPNKPAIIFINDIFNPNERIERQLSEIRDLLLQRGIASKDNPK